MHQSPVISPSLQSHPAKCPASPVDWRDWNDDCWERCKILDTVGELNMASLAIIIFNRTNWENHRKIMVIVGKI